MILNNITAAVLMMLSINIFSGENNPMIAFSEITYDFGEVVQGSQLEHIFTFTNQSSDKLIINSVQPSCGCTGVVMDEKKEFAQNESGEIEITFNTQGRSGQITKSVTVDTNDPANPVITLTFSCNIISK